MSLQRKHPRPWSHGDDAGVYDANGKLVAWAGSILSAVTFCEEANSEILTIHKPISQRPALGFRFIVDESLPEGVFCMFGSDVQRPVYGRFQ